MKRSAVLLLLIVLFAGSSPALAADDEVGADESATARTEAPAGAARPTTGETSTIDELSMDAGEPTTPAEVVRMDLARILAIARQKGREAQVAGQELKREVQQLHFVQADYHPRGQVVVTNEDDDSVVLSHKLSGGAKAQLSMNHTQSGNESQAVSIDHALFINNAFDLRIANLTFGVAKESYRSRMEQYKFQVTRSFFNLVRAQERLKTLLEGVQRARDLVAFARARFELGTANKIDVLNTQVDLANSQNQVIAQRQEVAKVRDELLDQVGLPLDVPLEAVDPLKLERPEDPGPGWYRSELLIERGRAEIARTRMNEAKYRTFPDVHLNASVSDDTGEGRPDVLTTVRYNFPIGTAPVDHEYRKLKRDYDISQYAYKTKQFEVAREKRDIVRTLATKENSVRIAARAMANARESYEASQVSFQRGIISSIDLRTAQTSLTNARDNYVSLLIDYRLATYQYRRTYGGDL